MKKNIFLFCLLLIGINVSRAQVFSCSSLCIQSITMDTTNNEVDVTVINAGTEQINYPVIVVVDTAGDTIANINADFYLFAQLGNDTVTHDLPTDLDSLPSNFTGTVYVTDAIYDTTCSYSYPMNCSTLSIAENSNIPNISIYPNPAEDHTIIDFGKSNDQKTIILFDVTGRELRRMNVTDSIVQIDREDLQSGVYFISVIIENNRITKKIVFK